MRDVDSGGHVSVKIQFIGSIKEATHERETIVNLPIGSSVGDLLQSLISKYGTEFRSLLFAAEHYINPGLSILVNGLEIQGNKGLETLLESAEISIAILPPMEGG